MYTKRAGSSDIAERPQKRTRAKLPPPPTNPQSFTRRHWTAEEDEALRAAMADIVPHRWKLIAERVPGRDHIQCLQRWQKVLDPSLVKVRLGIARHSRCAPQPPHRSHAPCAPPPHTTRYFIFRFARHGARTRRRFPVVSGPSRLTVALTPHHPTAPCACLLLARDSGQARRTKL